MPNRPSDLRLHVERVTGIEPAWPAWKVRRPSESRRTPQRLATGDAANRVGRRGRMRTRGSVRRCAGIRLRWVQTVGQVLDAVVAEQVQPVDDVQVAVALLTPYPDLLVQQLTHAGKGEGAHSQLGGALHGVHPVVGAHDRRPGSVLGDRAHDRG